MFFTKTESLKAQLLVLRCWQHSVKSYLWWIHNLKTVTERKVFSFAHISQHVILKMCGTKTDFMGSFMEYIRICLDSTNKVGHW